MVWKGRHGKQHLYIQELHNRYGDIVRIGPNEVSIRNVDAVAHLMSAVGLPKGPSQFYLADRQSKARLTRLYSPVGRTRGSIRLGPHRHQRPS